MAGFTDLRFSTELDSKGRVTVPAGIRNRLELEPGDALCLELKSAKILKKSFSSKSDALEYLEDLENVRNFSYDGETLEVAVR